jgi:hypothetical protein
MLQCEERRFDVRSETIHVIIYPRVERFINITMLFVFGFNINIVGSELPPEIVQIAPLVGGNHTQVVEGSGQHSPPDLRIMWLLHRAVNVPDDVCLSIHENGGFHGLEVVFETFP